MSLRRIVPALRTVARPAHPFTARTPLRTIPRVQLARSIHSTPSNRAGKKTVEEVKARNKSGPFSWRSGLLFLLSGAGLIFYFRYEKQRLERERVREQSKAVGRPRVGGPFSLIDHDGKEFTEQDLKGRFSLVYFGFTHCPDICPEELDKMAEMIDLTEAEVGDVMTPVFITCDPARDTPEVMKEYLIEFHPKIIGLTGTYDEIKKTCKAYRVYFSTPQHIKPGQDYLVDHSIYFYLMDPEGNFIEAIGRQHTSQDAARLITGHIRDWKGELRRK